MGIRTKFPVGTHVRALDHDGPVKGGDTGVVAGYKAKNEKIIGIRWDKYSKGMHHYENALRLNPKPKTPVPPGHGWYVFAKNLVKETVSAEEKKKFGVVNMHSNKRG